MEYFIIYLFIYLFTVRDLSLETDKTYPSTRLLLTFLLQNNKMFIVEDKENLIRKHAEIFVINMQHFYNPNILVNTKKNYI